MMSLIDSQEATSTVDMYDFLVPMEKIRGGLDAKKSTTI